MNSAVTVTPWGDSLRGDPRDIRTSEPDFYECGGGWDVELQALRTILTEGCVVIDVGAQYGYLTSYFSHLVGPAGQVHAIEASARTYTFLEANADSCQWDNVSTTNAAVGCTTGTGTFWQSDNRPGRSSLIAGNVPAENRASIRCRLTTVDEYWKGAMDSVEVALLKIDVEGAEIDVLLGAPSCLERAQNVWLEFWPDGIATAGRDPFSAVEVLHSAGFTLTCHDILSGETSAVPSRKWLSDHFDETARPRSSDLDPLFEPLVYLLAAR